MPADLVLVCALIPMRKPSLTLLAALTALAQTGASAPVKPSAPVSVPMLTAEVGGVTLRLEGCRLAWTSHEAGLPVFPVGRGAGNCQFARATSSQVQILEVEGHHVALIVSPEPRPGSRWCDNAVRAVIVGEGRVRLSVASQTLRICSAGPFDHKLLAVLGRDPDGALTR